MYGVMKRLLSIAKDVVSISDIQLYKKDEILTFIDLVKYNRESLNINEIILTLDTVKWIK
jgi:hypothetical protein